MAVTWLGNIFISIDKMDAKTAAFAKPNKDLNFGSLFYFAILPTFLIKKVNVITLDRYIANINY
jgi:hypothetical protein